MKINNILNHHYTCQVFHPNNKRRQEIWMNNILKIYNKYMVNENV